MELIKRTPEQKERAKKASAEAMKAIEFLVAKEEELAEMAKKFWIQNEFRTAQKVR